MSSLVTFKFDNVGTGSVVIIGASRATFYVGGEGQFSFNFESPIPALSLAEGTINVKTGGVALTGFLAAPMEATADLPPALMVQGLSGGVTTVTWPTRDGPVTQVLEGGAIILERFQN